MAQQLSPVTRVIWLLLNTLFGAGFATILFFWVACDMKMPQLIINFVSDYLPIMTPLFRVPYIEITFLSSSILGKLAFNAVLYAIFGIAHTVFAQEHVQSMVGRYLLPKQTLRTAYCIMVSVTAFLIIGFWQHTHIQLWDWLPSTMSLYQQQLVLLTMFNVILAPGYTHKTSSFSFIVLQLFFIRLVCDHQI
jgi:hypothetical protein